MYCGCLNSCACRSEFTEAFEDSSGFGWQQPMSRNDVKMLIEKKVGLYCVYIFDDDDNNNICM